MNMKQPRDYSPGLNEEGKLGRSYVAETLHWPAGSFELLESK